MKTGWQKILTGIGGRAPDPGNRGNAPAPPPVQTGPYEWIQWQMLRLRFTATDNLPVPPGFQNWSVIMLNSFGQSGLTGGGITGDVPQVQDVDSLYYDATTGLYVDLNGIVPV